MTEPIDLRLRNCLLQGFEKLMRALVVRRPGEYHLADIPVKRLRPGEALVKVSHNTLCGSDLRIFDGTMHDLHYPIVPGHEWCGEIVETNPRDSVLVGKRVVGEITFPCNECETCYEG